MYFVHLDDFTRDQALVNSFLSPLCQDSVRKSHKGNKHDKKSHLEVIFLKEKTDIFFITDHTTKTTSSSF